MKFEFQCVVPHLWLTFAFLLVNFDTSLSQQGGYSGSGLPESVNQAYGPPGRRAQSAQSQGQNRPLQGGYSSGVSNNNGGYQNQGFRAPQVTNGGYPTPKPTPLGGYGPPSTKPPTPRPGSESNRENGDEYDYIDPSPSPVTPQRGFVTTTVSPIGDAGKNKWDIRDSIPGSPGMDYPVLWKIPQTNFNCLGKTSGYYADPETRCQVFHRCEACSDQPGVLQQLDFLCPNGTLFNQQILTCDWWANVECKTSEQYFDINSQIRAQNSDGSFVQIPLFRRPPSEPKVAAKIIPVEQRQPLPPEFQSSHQDDDGGHHGDVKSPPLPPSPPRRPTPQSSPRLSTTRAPLVSTTRLPLVSTTRVPLISTTAAPPPLQSFQADGNFADYLNDDNFIDYRRAKPQRLPDLQSTENFNARYRNADLTQQRQPEGFIVNQRPNIPQNTSPQLQNQILQNAGTTDRSIETNNQGFPQSNNNPSYQYQQPTEFPAVVNQPIPQYTGPLAGNKPLDSYGPPSSNNYGSPSSNNYEPPSSNNYEPPSSNNYEPPSRNNYGSPSSNNYGPPSSNNYEPPSNTNYAPPPRSNYDQANFNSPNNNANQATQNLQPDQSYNFQGINDNSNAISQPNEVYGANAVNQNNERSQNYEQDVYNNDLQHPRFHRQPDEKPHLFNQSSNHVDLSRYVTVPPPVQPTQQDSYQPVQDNFYRKPSRGYGNDDPVALASYKFNADEPQDSFGAYPANPQDSSWG